MTNEETVENRSELVQGTLDMLILKALQLEPLHGYGLSQRLQQISRGVFQVNAGSIFPALRRLEKEGWIQGEWRASENNRRARYYRPTAAGARQLQRERRRWERVSTAIGRVLEAS